MKTTLLLIILSTSFAVQAKKNLDSLWGIWLDTSQGDTARADALHDVIWGRYAFNEPDSAIYFCKVLYNMSCKIKLPDIKKRG